MVCYHIKTANVFRKLILGNGSVWRLWTWLCHTQVLNTTQTENEIGCHNFMSNSRDAFYSGSQEKLVYLPCIIGGTDSDILYELLLKLRGQDEAGLSCYC